jgi:hypothetical protein
MSQQGFDASSIKRSTWIAGVGAVLLLLSTFVAWWKVSALGFSVNASGWDTGALGKLVFFVALIAVIAVVVEHMDVDVSSSPISMPALILTCGCVGVLLVLIRFFDTPDHVDWAWGLYLALIAACVLTYGGWEKLQQAGAK